jgi:hypothetical protein
MLGLDVPETVVDWFGSQPLSECKEAAFHFVVVAMALASEQIYDELYGFGCPRVLLAGLDCLQDHQLGFTLRILVRGIRMENEAHTIEYRELLRQYPGVVPFLEDVRGGERAEYAQMADGLLRYMFPDDMIEV